jgi:hypothetical protein
MGVNRLHDPARLGGGEEALASAALALPASQRLELLFHFEAGPGLIQGIRCGWPLSRCSSCRFSLIQLHRLAQLLQGLPALAAALHQLDHLLLGPCRKIQCTGSAGPLGAIAPLANLSCELE